MSFVQRAITVAITLGVGNFGEGKGETVTIKGHRVECGIVKAGGASQGQAQLRIYGMSLSTMNKLSNLGLLVTSIAKNIIVVTAGDVGTELGVVFQGNIFEAWIDADGMPEVAFVISAFSAGYAAMRRAPPRSYGGPTSAASVMASLATQEGFAFENSGVTVMLADPYFPGTPYAQMERCAKAGGFNMIVDNGTLAIWPKGSNRRGAVPLISPKTGLVGYPAYTSQGIIVRTEYSPSVGYGSLIQVESEFTPACGQWVVQRLEYRLSAETPGGDWFTIMAAGRPGFAIIR